MFSLSKEAAVRAPQILRGNVQQAFPEFACHDGSVCSCRSVPLEALFYPESAAVFTPAAIGVDGFQGSCLSVFSSQSTLKNPNYDSFCLLHAYIVHYKTIL